MKILNLPKRSDEKYWDNLWSLGSLEKSTKYLKEYRTYKLVSKYLNDNSKIIEGGCGLSQWVYDLHNDGYNIIGIDYAKNTVASINKDYPELNVVYGDITNFSFEEKSFSTYLSWGVVEHFQEGPEKALSEAYRILDDDGILIVSVPFLNPVRKSILKDKDEIGEGYFFQYFFDDVEFSKILKDCGFSVVETLKSNWIIGAKEYFTHLKGEKLDFNVYEGGSISSSGSNSSNVLKEVLKKVIISFSDNSLLTHFFGHMIVFVAKKEK